MKLAAICCTYLRPQELASAVESYLRQDYPEQLRELIILDDAGQYNPDALRHFPGVKLVTIPYRFRTLGEKRNASAALVSADVEAYCVWDDDDIYLPWHMSAAAKSLASADYTIPTLLYTEKQQRLEQKTNQYLFHGAWSIRRNAFDRVNGYPFIQSGQDQGLLRRLKNAKMSRADPITYDPRPSYVYRWFTTSCRWHISAMGPGGYEKLSNKASERIDCLAPGWDRDWLMMHDISERSLREAKP